MSPINTILTALKFRQPSTRNDVLGPQAFQEVLSTERARSDRSGWPFTLVVINLATATAGNREFDVLLEVVNDRTRQIDFKGWHNGSLALILPYTHIDNANQLLNSIEQQFAKRVQKEAGALSAQREIDYTVYCYPPTLDRNVKTV